MSSAKKQDNRMSKTRDLFKKIGGKGTFPARIGKTSWSVRSSGP